MNDMNTVLPDLLLRFNIDHPNLEDCYALGYECAEQELDETTNPFKPDTIEAEQWQEGWWAGFYGEAPLFEWSSERDERLVETDIDEHKTYASNDEVYQESSHGFFRKMWEITGVIAVSALVGYQVIDMVA